MISVALVVFHVSMMDSPGLMESEVAEREQMGVSCAGEVQVVVLPALSLISMSQVEIEAEMLQMPPPWFIPLPPVSVEPERVMEMLPFASGVLGVQFVPHMGSIWSTRNSMGSDTPIFPLLSSARAQIHWWVVISLMLVLLV